MELLDLQINTTKKIVNQLIRYTCKIILVFMLASFGWSALS